MFPTGTKTSEIFHVTEKEVKTFKSVTGNRNVRDMSHINNIKQEFLKGNYIPPVIINKDKYLVDGQHRCNAFLMACKESNKLLTLQVIVDPSNMSSLELAIQYNSNRKNWGTQDYMNAFVTDNRESYILLKQFNYDHELEIKSGIQIIKGSHSTETFKAGALNITTQELMLAENKMKILSQLANPNVIGQIVLRRDIILGFYQAYNDIKDSKKFIINLMKNKSSIPTNEKSSEWKRFYLSQI